METPGIPLSYTGCQGRDKRVAHPPNDAIHITAADKLAVVFVDVMGGQPGHAEQHVIALAAAFGFNALENAHHERVGKNGVIDVGKDDSNNRVLPDERARAAR